MPVMMEVDFLGRSNWRNTIFPARQSRLHTLVNFPDIFDTRQISKEAHIRINDESEVAFFALRILSAAELIGGRHHARRVICISASPTLKPYSRGCGQGGEFSKIPG